MKRWWPLVLLLILMVAAYISGALSFLSFENIKSHRALIQGTIESHPFWSATLYTLIYIVATSLSLPGATPLTILGGFFFGIPEATICVVVGATVGATTIFLVARTALGDFLRKRAGPFLKKLEKGLLKNTASYLLFLRFIPLFPFWIVNIAPAFFKVRLSTFIWTTSVGIIPGSYVYTQAGSSLGDVFEHGEAFSLDSIFTTEMKFSLILLALFAIIPIFVKYVINKRKKS